MTPKDYLSWTQLDLVERSPEKYVEVYLEGGRVPINRGMAYGRKVAQALENGDLTGDPVLDLIIAQMPKLEKREHEIRTFLNDIPLYGKLDDFDPKRPAFKEYKTGIHPWTQKKADNHGQIDFYCTLIYGKYRIRPEDLDIELVWIPTQYDAQGRIEACGDTKPFKVKKTMVDVLKMSARQQRAWNKIKELTMESLL